MRGLGLTPTCWQGASISEACRIAALNYGFCVQSPRPARRPASPTAPARLPLAHKAVIEHRPLWRLNWHNQGWRQHCALLPASRALYLYLRLQTAEASSSGHPLLEGEGTRLWGVGHAAYELVVRVVFDLLLRPAAKELPHGHIGMCRGERITCVCTVCVS